MFTAAPEIGGEAIIETADAVEQCDCLQVDPLAQASPSMKGLRDVELIVWTR
jgi:hypothetical protein